MLIKSLAIAAAFVFSIQAWAVDPKPGINAVTDKNQDVIGTIQYDKKPAVSEEALKATSAEAPAKVINSSYEPHLFGFHGALGVPHPFSAGVNYFHSSRLFSAEFSIGSYGITVSDVKVKMSHTELALRWHPWAGSFYLGALYGNQTISAEKTEFISAASQYVTAKVDVKSNYITPHFGWMWGAADGGFFSSIEFGYQSPSGVKTEFTSDAPGAATATQEYRDLEKDVRDEGDKIGNMGLPHIVLIKLGWFF